MQYALCECAVKWGAQQVHGDESCSTTAVLGGMIHIKMELKPDAGHVDVTVVGIVNFSQTLSSQELQTKSCQPNHRARAQLRHLLFILQDNKVLTKFRNSLRILQSGQEKHNETITTLSDFKASPLTRLCNDSVAETEFKPNTGPLEVKVLSSQESPAKLCQPNHSLRVQETHLSGMEITY
ncbi:hypothetical protein DPMN_003796 [Dreissena polymorpha]|uniref:Uncharacterized protein n=1 Tax=Dreissena polymorpha TaxID=45954 RepID=A0A9D4RSE4_DREPO|nr:hypothetical protein DPMN_003796 [Dreissena polymorpha]